MNRGDRELELLLREVDQILDHAVAQDRESELERMAMLGALQGLARVGSGIGRVSGGLSRLSSVGRAAGSLGRVASRGRAGSLGRVASRGRAAGSRGRVASRGRAAGSRGRVASRGRAASRGRVTTRRTYPRFTVPTGAEMPSVRNLARQLSRQSKLRIRTDQILDAPWIGRGTPRSTSEGWLRDSRAFWRVFGHHAPAAHAALAGTHRVTPAYARLMGWPRSTVGQQLIHHHILNSHFVVPLPASAHGAAVHRIARILGRP
jgi:HNH/Endo VII superfamily nuclease toxin with a HHH motif